MKKCSRCQEYKEIGNFSKSGKYYNSWCRQCKAFREAERRLEKGVVPKKRPILTTDSKQCLLCLQILLLSFFPANKRGRLSKSSYCKTCTQVYHRQDKFKEAKRKYTQRYRDNNRLHWRALHRLNQFKRRHQIEVTADGTVTKEFLEALFLQKICPYCKQEILEKDKTIEHIIPLNKGGTHTADNVTMCCKTCNFSKQDKLVEEFIRDRS